MDSQIPGRSGASFKADQRPPVNQKTKPFKAPKQKQTPAGPQSRWNLGMTFLAFVVVVFIAFFAYNFVLDNQFKTKTEEGVSVSGIYVGDMTRDVAKARIMKSLENYTQNPVKLSFQDQTWTPTLEQLGVTINLDSTLDKAFGFNRGGLRVLKVLQPESTNLPIEITLDEAKLNGFLTDISARLHLDGTEPTIRIDDNGTLITTEGKTGINVDYDATMEALKKTISSLQPTTDNLLKVHNVDPVITQAEVDTFKASIQPYLNGLVTISYGDKNWTFDQKTIASQLKITVNPDKKEPKHLGYTFNTPYFENYISGLSKDINQAAQDGVIGWLPSGKPGFTKPSVDGQFLSVPRTMDNLNQALVATDPAQRKTTLWVDVKEPALSSKHPELIGNFDVIGEGVSLFAGSTSARATNIKVGAQHLSGAIIKPHAMFSFLDTIGQITEKEGYVTGFSIVADQTVPDVGGGICQVATTAFRAAFYAGLPIEERNPHAYRVGWYEELGEPVGFDAAVYQPGVDLKFDNNSDYYMAVTASVEDGKLYVRILGNQIPGQTVKLIAGDITNIKDALPDRTEVDPKLKPGQKVQYDSARKGLTTSITRVISVDGKEVKRTTFASVYAPWPNIYKIGPTPTPPPATATPTGTAKPTTPAAPSTPSTPKP